MCLTTSAAVLWRKRHERETERRLIAFGVKDSIIAYQRAAASYSSFFTFPERRSKRLSLPVGAESATIDEDARVSRWSERGEARREWSRLLTPGELLVSNLEVRVSGLLVAVVVTLRKDVGRESDDAGKTHKGDVPPHRGVGLRRTSRERGARKSERGNQDGETRLCVGPGQFEALSQGLAPRSGQEPPRAALPVRGPAGGGS